MAQNVTFLHSGVLDEEATFLPTSAGWAWTETVIRSGSFGKSYNFLDASAFGDGYLLVSPDAPSVHRIADSDGTATTIALSGTKGCVQLCYDAALHVFHGLHYFGNVQISRIKYRPVDGNLSEQYYVDLGASYPAGDAGRPAMCLSKAGTYLFVVSQERTNPANSRIYRIRIDATTYTVTGSLVVPAEFLDMHAMICDTAGNGDIYITSGGTVSSGGWMRVTFPEDDVTAATIKWYQKGPFAYAGYVTTPQFHDDVAIDSSYIYAPSGQGLNGVAKISKATGNLVAILNNKNDPAYMSGSGVGLDPTTGAILYTTGYGASGGDSTNTLQQSRPDGTKFVYRQPGEQTSVWDDAVPNGAGSYWAMPVKNHVGQDYFVYKLAIGADGPAGAGRVRCQPQAASPRYFTKGPTSNSVVGCYIGIQYNIATAAFNSDHWTILTLSATTQTAGWFAKLVRAKTTGQLQVRTVGGVIYTCDTPALGWHYLEVRYDVASGRIRVYSNNSGTPVLDVTDAALATNKVQQVFYGPWDADQAETAYFTFHCAFDLDFDDANYDGTRWGDVTALLAGPRSSNLGGADEWTSTGDVGIAAIQVAADLILGGALAPGGNTSYIATSGAVDKYNVWRSQFYSKLIRAIKHVRIGVRALRTQPAGRLAIGFGGATVADKNGVFTWSANFDLTASATLYELRVTAAVAGGALSASDLRIALKYVGRGTDDAKITQVHESILIKTTDVTGWGPGRLTDTRTLDVGVRGGPPTYLLKPVPKIDTRLLDVAERGGPPGVLDFLPPSQNVSVTTGMIILVGTNPTIAPAVTIIATAGQITLVGASPAIVSALTTVATVGTITLVGTSPTLSMAVTQPTIVALITFVSTSPTTVTGGIIAVMSVGLISLTGSTAIALGTVTVVVAVGLISINGSTAIAVGAFTQTAGNGVIVLAGTIPTTNIVIVATVGLVTISGTIPGVVWGFNQAATVGFITITGGAAAGLSAGGSTNAIFTVGSITITGNIPAPLVGGIAIVASVAVISVLTTIPVPGTTVTSVVSPGTILMLGGTATGTGVAVLQGASVGLISVVGGMATGSASGASPQVGGVTQGNIVVSGSIAIASPGNTLASVVVSGSIVLTGTLGQGSVSSAQSALVTVGMILVTGRIATFGSARTGVKIETSGSYVPRDDAQGSKIGSITVPGSYVKKVN